MAGRLFPKLAWPRSMHICTRAAGSRTDPVEGECHDSEPSAHVIAACRGGEPPRLLDQVAQAARQRGASQPTTAQLVSCVRAFVLYHGKRHPCELGLPAVTRFLEHVVRTEKQPLPALEAARSALSKPLVLPGVALPQRRRRQDLKCQLAEVALEFRVIGHVLGQLLAGEEPVGDCSAVAGDAVEGDAEAFLRALQRAEREGSALGRLPRCRRPGAGRRPGTAPERRPPGRGAP